MIGFLVANFLFVVDEFHCSTLDMVTPDFDVDDSDVYDSDSEDDGDYPPLVYCLKRRSNVSIELWDAINNHENLPLQKPLFKSF